jgi:4-hydroxybenzoate polyprenyltransferase
VLHKGHWRTLSRVLAEVFLFLFGAAVATNTIPLAIYFTAFFFFLYSVASNIAHSIEDHQGDKEACVRTLAVSLGPSKAAEKGFQFFLVALIVSVIPALINLSTMGATAHSGSPSFMGKHTRFSARIIRIE